MTERLAAVFDCDGSRLVGVIELPDAPADIGLLIVTGGPQYRTGSHRQFALLGRAVAAAGFAAMTFDYRGSGDSEGARASFESLDIDIRAALDEFCVTAGVRRVVLLGLCDAASAALMYAPADERVAGLVLLNPWVRTTGSLERARLQRYYPARLASPTFWKRLLTGRVPVRAALRSLRRQIAGAAQTSPSESEDFRERMLAGARVFAGPVLVILAGRDLTAQEYRDLLEQSAAWRQRLSGDRVRHHEIAAANHTFSTAAWRDEVTEQCRRFLAGLTDQTSSSAGGG